MADPKMKWDTSYEWKAVTLLGLGFGLVGLDRWIIAPLFPFMMKDLNLGYQDLGNLIGILGLCWGVFAIVMGGVSDRIGRRKVLIPAILLFSLLSGLSGLAIGLGSLIMIRAIMGLTEGSYCPTSFAATNEASAPKRRGFNQGIQQCTFALFGLGFGPIIATQLMAVVPSWRWVFIIVAIPGFILGTLMYFVLRDAVTQKTSSKSTESTGRWVEIFRSRNIVLSMAALLCAMTGVFVLSAMVAQLPGGLFAPDARADGLCNVSHRLRGVRRTVWYSRFVGCFRAQDHGDSGLCGRRHFAVYFYCDRRQSSGFVCGAIRDHVFLPGVDRAADRADRD